MFKVYRDEEISKNVDKFDIAILSWTRAKLHYSLECVTCNLMHPRKRERENFYVILIILFLFIDLYM